jgi:uncharacterized protein
MNKHRPRVNIMSDVARFLQSWDTAENQVNHEPVVLHETAHGNINSTGETGNYDGHALTPWHGQFEQAIESGIRSLVLVLVRQCGWVTYSSCEGHRYDAPYSLHPVERYVGILPRTPLQYIEVYERLKRVSENVHGRFPRFPVTVTPIELDLESEESSYKVIDFFFLKHRLAPWWLYFAALDRYYAVVLDEMSSNDYSGATL